MKLNDAFAAYVGSDRVRRIYKGATKVFEAPWAMEELAFYHDLQTPDASYETLPGNTLATAQNDGIGAVLDLKRYKERGPELVPDPGFDDPEAWTATGSSPAQWSVSGGIASVDNRGTGSASCYLSSAQIMEEGKLYELSFELVSSAGTGLGVRLGNSTGNTGPYVKAIGVHTFLLRSTGTNYARFQAAQDWMGSVDNVSVREIPGYHAIQDLAAAQPVLNIEGGVRSALFDGVDDRLVIPGTAGAFNFLHNGEGGEAWVCCRAATAESGARYVFGNGTTTEVGVLALFNGSRVQTLLSNASGSSIATAQSATGVVVAGEKAVYRFSYQPDEVRVYKGGTTLVAQAALSGTPSSADAARNMTIGNWASTAGTFAGDVYAWGIIQGALSDYDAQRLATYMLRRAGA